MSDADKVKIKDKETSIKKDDNAGSESDDGDGTIEKIRKFFANKLSFHDSKSDSNEKIIEDLSFNGFIEHWKNGGVKNIITMVGAGVSTSAGIPDFRSPGSGLYNNLAKYNLPHAQAIFELSYFNENPKPFFQLAKELYPGTFKPTPSHYFIKLLNEKGLLIRHYTQNIDTLERIAEIPEEKLVEAHGTFFTNHCLDCRKEYSMQWAKEEIFKDKIPTCEDCKGLVKPDIVFFGENLPDKFYDLPCVDFDNCDLLIIMGTSLEVQPFASLIERCSTRCLRLLINRDKVGRYGNQAWFMGGPDLSLKYDDDDNIRDTAWIGDCDEGVLALAKGLGWEEELKEMIRKEHEKIDKNQSNEKEKTGN